MRLSTALLLAALPASAAETRLPPAAAAPEVVSPIAPGGPSLSLPARLPAVLPDTALPASALTVPASAIPAATAAAAAAPAKTDIPASGGNLPAAAVKPSPLARTKSSAAPASSDNAAKRSRAASAQLSDAADAASKPEGAAPTPAAAVFDGGARRKDSAWNSFSRLSDPSRPQPFAENRDLPVAEGTPESLAEARRRPALSRSYTPSPKDWRDESLYFVMLDRFARSKDAKPLGDPRNPHSRHGGDLRGVIERLDYIKGSGVTTLLLSPVTATVPEAYHGYAPMNLLAVDPRLGTMADLQELVREAHARGLRVVLDWVVNHTGPAFEYKDGSSRWRGLDGPAQDVVWTHELRPLELRDPSRFTRRGEIEDWDDHAQATHGDFPPNYRHLATDDAETQRVLIDIAQWWIEQTDVDGFRLDAIRHIAPAFRARFAAEIKAFAAGLGKKKFLLLGENSTGVDAELAPYVQGAGGIDSLYHYPAYRRENRALHGQAPAAELAQSHELSQNVLGAMGAYMTRFIDNQDTYRFLRPGEPAGLLTLALSFLMLSAGIPLVYYGTEQGFRQLVDRLDPEGPDLPADPQNREDMFPEGLYKSSSSAGDKFDPAAPGYRALRRLAALRRDYPALRRGRQYVRYADPKGAGLYAFSRVLGDVDVLVVMNTAATVQSAQVPVDAGLHPSGTLLKDALDPEFRVMTAPGETGGPQALVEVPPHGVRVLVRRLAKGSGGAA